MLAVEDKQGLQIWVVDGVTEDGVQCDFVKIGCSGQLPPRALLLSAMPESRLLMPPKPAMASMPSLSWQKSRA